MRFSGFSQGGGGSSSSNRSPARASPDTGGSSAARGSCGVGSMIAADLRRRRPKPHSTCHLDEVFIKIDGRLVYYGAPSTLGAKSLTFLCRASERRATLLPDGLSSLSSHKTGPLH
jgi:hypothetical protein